VICGDGAAESWQSDHFSSRRRWFDSVKRIRIGDIPDSQSAIMTSCDDRRADDSERLDKVACPSQLANRCATGHIEDTDRGIARGRHNLVTFANKADTRNFPARALNRPLLFSGVDGPDLHDIIRAARDKPPAMCLPGDREDVAGVSLERSFCCAIRDDVHLGKTIGASRCQSLPIA
jgi:hypothetical protein